MSSPALHGQLAQSGLYAAAIPWGGGTLCPLQSAETSGEQQRRIAMHFPETPQQIQSRVRQRHEPVFVALGIADVHALALRIEVAHLESKPFSRAQPQAVDGEIENPVAERAGCVSN